MHKNNMFVFCRLQANILYSQHDCEILCKNVECRLINYYYWYNIIVIIYEKAERALKLYSFYTCNYIGIINYQFS